MAGIGTFYGVPWEAILGSGGGLAVLAKFSYEGFSAWRSRRAGRSFKSAWNLYKSMHLLMDTIGAHRCLVLRAHNGGGDLSVRTPTYTSVLHEVYDHSVDSVFSQWQKRRLDEQYYGLLRRVYVEETVELRTEEMVDCQLKSVYGMHGVAYSLVSKLYVENKGFFYLSLTFSKEPPRVDEVKARVMGALSHIQTIIKK